jgi:hypothetical protein
MRRVFVRIWLGGCVRGTSGFIVSEHVYCRMCWVMGADEQDGFADVLLTNTRDAPFIYDAWTDPTVLNALSEIAGIELVPAWNYDIGNVNISVPSEGTGEHKTAIPTSSDGSEADLKPANNNDDTAFGWHYDSVPFVCVTMLSDCTGMVGGETMIRTGDRRYMKTRGPATVSFLFQNCLTSRCFIPHLCDLSR